MVDPAITEWLIQHPNIAGLFYFAAYFATAWWVTKRSMKREQELQDKFAEGVRRGIEYAEQRPQNRRNESMV
jgi:hypothetical protein